MTSRWINIAADGGAMKGYLSLPPAGHGPGIVLIQEIFGVNGHIRAVADQYALDGYVVLAPDVFWRIEPGVDIGYGEKDFARGMGLMQKLDFPHAVKDLAAATKALRGLSECKGKVASLGYCMGGLLSYLCAANAGVDAAVCYYGGGIPNHLGEAGKIRCPVLFHFGANDKHIPLEGVEQVKKTFASKSGSAVHVYPGADHAFNRWVGASYHQPSAALAHGRSLSFLATVL